MAKIGIMRAELEVVYKTLDEILLDLEKITAALDKLKAVIISEVSRHDE